MTRQAGITDFIRPESELDSLILSVENMLRTYKKRESRFPLDPDDEELDVRRLCDHRSEFGGNFSRLEARLNSKLQGTPYQATAETQLELSDLEDIIGKQTSSFPLVELHPDYYDHIEEYHVQMGQFGKNEIPILIPVIIEEDMVIYWDPFLDYYSGISDSSNEITISDNVFLQLWSQTDRARWTLWIDRGDQETLTQFQEEEQ